MANLTPTAVRHTALRRTARGGVLNLCGAVFSGAGGIVVTWLVADGLGQVNAGQFFTATSAFLLCTAVARLGTPTGLVYWIASHKRHAPRDVAAVIRYAFTPTTITSIVVGSTLYLAAPILAAQTDSSASFTASVQTLAVFLPCVVILEGFLAASRGLGSMRATVVIEKVGRTSAQLLLLFAVISIASPDTALVTLVWAWAYLPAAIAAAWWWRRARPFIAFDSPKVTVSAKQFWSYTWPRAFSGIIQLALQRLDIMLVASILGFAEAAIYTVATRFLTLGQLASAAVGTALQPRLATCLGRRDLTTAKMLYQATTAWIVLATWPLYLVTALMAKDYLRLFGTSYVSTDAITVVWILCVGALAASASGVVDSVLSMAGRTSWQLANVSVALAVNIIVDVLLLPSWGIVGAAIGWTCALLVKNGIPLVQLAFTFGLHPFGRASVATFALCLGCFAVLAGLRPWLPITGFVVLLALVGAVFAATVWRFRGVFFAQLIS